MAIAFCGLVGTLLPAFYGLIVGIPEPVVQDEFSYLLGADTFLHGRLTNPPPSLPEFFEASHVLVAPTYASKYPPGPALALAFGQLTAGRPIWGVWISCGVFAASLCWMLQAWTSRRWALAGTLMAMVALGVSTYWAQSYWGGMLAASGSALVFGGLRRTWRQPCVVPSLLTGLGVVILASTRIYEGMLVCVVPATLLGWWLLRTHRVPLRTKLLTWLVPLSAVLLIGGVLTAVYNHAVTGRWLATPHGVFSRQYFGQGVFLFSALEQPERRPVPRLASFYEGFRYQPHHGWGLIRNAVAHVYGRLPAMIESALGVVGPFEGSRQPYRVLVLWIVALVAVALQHAWARIAVASIGVVALGQSLVWWWIPHYTAPVVPLVIAMVVMTFARGARAGAGRRLGPPVVVLVAVMYVAIPAFMGLAQARFGGPQQQSAASVNEHELAELTKRDVVRRLENERGLHLVFVSYEDDGPAGDGEWVYNGADLLNARVLFVHDLGHARNAQLIAEYPDRHFWHVTLTKHQTTRRLEPYQATVMQPAAVDGTP